MRTCPADSDPCPPIGAFFQIQRCYRSAGGGGPRPFRNQEIECMRGGLQGFQGRRRARAVDYCLLHSRAKKHSTLAAANRRAASSRRLPAFLGRRSSALSSLSQASAAWLAK